MYSIMSSNIYQVSNYYSFITNIYFWICFQTIMTDNETFNNVNELNYKFKLMIISKILDRMT